MGVVGLVIEGIVLGYDVGEVWYSCFFGVIVLLVRGIGLVRVGDVVYGDRCL